MEARETLVNGRSKMTQPTEVTEGVAFDISNTLWPPVQRLIEGTDLHYLVTYEFRGGVGAGQVAEIHPRRPVATWSTGEKVLWDLLVSLGYSDVPGLSLYTLLDRWRGSQVTRALSLLIDEVDWQ